MLSTTLISIAALIFIAYNGILYYTLADLSKKVNLIERKLEDSIQALRKEQADALNICKDDREYQETLLSSRIELIQQRQVQAVSDLHSKLKGFKENFMNNY
jgi:hypothetical protein